MSSYFKNIYRCYINEQEIPMKSFYYRADMAPVLRWRRCASGWSSGAWRRMGGNLDGFATIYIFYFFAPQITETLQVTAADVPTFQRIWNATDLQWEYSPQCNMFVRKTISHTYTFDQGARGSSVLRPHDKHEIFPRDIDTCRMVDIRSDTGAMNYTSTWRSQGAKEHYFVVPDWGEPGASIAAFFNLRNTVPSWPTGGNIYDGTYVRNDPDAWGVRCSPRSEIQLGQWINFGAVKGRVNSLTEWASSGQAVIEIGGYHDYMEYDKPGTYLPGVGEPSTFYGLTKIIGYETKKYVGQPWSGQWDIFCFFERGPSIGDPAAVDIQQAVGFDLWGEGTS